MIDHKWVDRQIQERADAKAAGDFERADSIRLSLHLQGIELKDTAQGVVANAGTDWVIREKDAEIARVRGEAKGLLQRIASLERANNDYSARVQSLNRELVRLQLQLRNG